MTNPYSPAWRERHRAGARSSATAIAELIAELLPPGARILDVGCGEGWLCGELEALGFEARGIDGPWVDGAEQYDLAAGELPELGSYDLVACLEVAEHLPAERAEAFAAWLSDLAPIVLFAAAIPGQGGVGHIAERWPAWWAELFARAGLSGSGALRARIWDDERLDWWYRQNLLVFAGEQERARRPAIPAPDGCPALIHPGLWAHRIGAPLPGAEPLPPRNVRLIIPRRADGGARDRLWAFCRARLEAEHPSWEIAEGFHDDGPFNRSAAINAAAFGAWDVALILDADVIVPAAQLAEAAARAASSGRAVLAFEERRLLGEAGTEAVLAGAEPALSQTIGRERKNYSTAIAVPRPLWEELGGFDERFEGWGGEDDAFWAAASAIGGPIERIPGPAWHLDHPISEWRGETPEYRQARALAGRYIAAARSGPEAIRRILAERAEPDGILLLCLTTGRREHLAAALASAEKLSGPISRRLLILDSPSAQLEARLEAAHPSWEIQRIKAGRYDRAMDQAMTAAIGSGQPWVFWLEDDFEIAEPIDLAAMQELMGEHPELAQLSLLRQPWYPEELEAGGIIEAAPEAFEQAAGYISHRAYWTQNPMLARRELLARHPWPRGPGSEARFGEALLADPELRFGILGKIGDPPRCTHLGRKRAGRGY